MKSCKNKKYRYNKSKKQIAGSNNDEPLGVAYLFGHEKYNNNEQSIKSIDILPDIVKLVNETSIRKNPTRLKRSLSGKKEATKLQRVYIEQSRLFSYIIYYMFNHNFTYYSTIGSMSSKDIKKYFKNDELLIRLFQNYTASTYKSYINSGKLKNYSGYCGEASGISAVEFIHRKAFDFIVITSTGNINNHKFLLLPPKNLSENFNLTINNNYFDSHNNLNFEKLINDGFVIYDPLHNFVISKEKDNLTNNFHQKLDNFIKQLNNYTGILDKKLSILTLNLQKNNYNSFDIKNIFNNIIEDSLRYLNNNNPLIIYYNLYIIENYQMYKEWHISIFFDMLDLLVDKWQNKYDINWTEVYRLYIYKFNLFALNNTYLSEFYYPKLENKHQKE